jgi:hypothetical protein
MQTYLHGRQAVLTTRRTEELCAAGSKLITTREQIADISDAWRPPTEQ